MGDYVCITPERMLGQVRPTLRTAEIRRRACSQGPPRNHTPYMLVRALRPLDKISLNHNIAVLLYVAHRIRTSELSSFHA